MSDAETMVCDLRSLGGPDAERMADETRLTALVILARRAADYIEKQAAELARKSTVADAQWEIIESFKKENAELRAAQDIKLDAAYRNGLNQAARIISQYEMENKTTDGIKHVAAISARLTDQIIKARTERKARAILAQHAPQAGKED